MRLRNWIPVWLSTRSGLDGFSVSHELATTWRTVLAGCKAFVLSAAGATEEAQIHAAKVIELNKTIKRGLSTGIMPMFFALQVACSAGNRVLFEEGVNLLRTLFDWTSKGQKIYNLLRDRLPAPSTVTIIENQEDTNSISLFPTNTFISTIQRPPECFDNLFEGEEDLSSDFIQFILENNLETGL